MTTQPPKDELLDLARRIVICAQKSREAGCADEYVFLNALEQVLVHGKLEDVVQKRQITTSKGETIEVSDIGWIGYALAWEEAET